MANLKNILEGLKIILVHVDGANEWLDAQHDIIYAPDKPNPDSAAGKELENLGWFWDNDADCWAVFT